MYIPQNQTQFKQQLKEISIVSESSFQPQDNYFTQIMLTFGIMDSPEYTSRGECKV